MPKAFNVVCQHLQIYTEGSENVPKDYIKAMQYFEKAADQVSKLLDTVCAKQ